MIARGWARLSAAAAVSTALVAVTEGPKKLASLKAYAVDLQQQVRDSDTTKTRNRGSLGGKEKESRLLLFSDVINVLNLIAQTSQTWVLLRSFASSASV